MTIIFQNYCPKQQNKAFKKFFFAQNFAVRHIPERWLEIWQ